MPTVLTERELKAMVIGGAILGAGGGGTIAEGMQAGREAFAIGSPRLFDIDEIAPEARIVTLSGVGGVRSQNSSGLEQNFARAVAVFRRHDTAPIGGLIASEVGPRAVTYGWSASLQTAIPLVDAPCNGRAHPLGTMGSLGLQNIAGYCPLTVAMAQTGCRNAKIETLVFRSDVTTAAARIRRMAAQIRGSIAVVRNPVPASYLRHHAAVGGLKRAMQWGQFFLDQRPHGLEQAIQALAQRTKGKILMRGTIRKVTLQEIDGFTFGMVQIKAEPSRTEGRIVICNEALEFTGNGLPYAVFPDVITVFDAATRLPLNTGALQTGQEVIVLQIPRQLLLLGSPMTAPDLPFMVQKLLAKARQAEKVKNAA